MQIGEFAALCNTKISVLRHYDKEGLLSPDYIDGFTGYRYYREEQAETFRRIIAMKSAGFTLVEIKKVISDENGNSTLDDLFESKKKELLSKLSALENSKEIMQGESLLHGVQTVAEGEEYSISIKCAEPMLFDEKKSELQRFLTLQGHQRITPFRLSPSGDGGYTVSCRTVKLGGELRRLYETETFVFENDSDAVGKWQIIGEYAVYEDFFNEAHFEERVFSKRMNYLYFLPRGENYWCFEWTRGKLIIARRDNERFVNTYTIRKVGSELYMFVDLKSYSYRRGGRTTVLVLKRLDNVSYSREDIARCDDLALPFVNDERVIGKWTSVDFVRSIDEFSPSCPSGHFELFYRSAEFFENGRMKSTYSNGDIIESPSAQEWTWGIVKCKWTGTACSYEIRELDGELYMFLEWKSGDWIFGGMDCSYYVFKKEV